MIQMYDGVVNSIETVTTGSINSTDTIINVLDEIRIPEAPNILVLGSGASAETVKLIEKNGSVITVERGLQGVAKSWASGTLVARNFTEYDHKAFKENIEELGTNQGDLTLLETTDQSNIVGAVNEVNTQLAQDALNLTNHTSATTAHADATNLLQTLGNQIKNGTLTLRENGGSIQLILERYGSAVGIAQLGASSNGLEIRTNVGVGFTVAHDGKLFLGTLNTTPNISRGSGSPEGTVTARVGSLYLREDGGTSTTLYVKQSGTGNMGWVAK